MANIEIIVAEAESSGAIVGRSKLHKPTEAFLEPEVIASTSKLRKPKEAFLILQRSLNFLSMLGIVIGTDLKYQWKPNLRWIITKFLTGFCWFLFLYTQLLYVYQHRILKTCEVFAIYGMGVSAVLKIRCFDNYFTNITALFKATLKLCTENCGRRGEKLKNRVEANFTFYKCVSCLGILCTVIYMFYPVKSFLIDGVLVPFVPLEIIFVDQSTLSGFFIASGITVTCGLYAVFGTLYMGLVFVYLIMNYMPRVDVLEIDFNELDELWGNKSNSTLAYRHNFLSNICRKYIDMRKYIAEIKKIFDEKLFIFFAFAYFSQILCLYQIRANNWIPGYALAIGFFLEMIFYCTMGTRVTLANERFCYIITQSNWYTYDIDSQKSILILLNLSMNFEELYIGPVKPLSVLTATEIVKSIYSYYTLMMEVM